MRIGSANVVKTCDGGLGYSVSYVADTGSTIKPYAVNLGGTRAPARK